MQRSSMSAEFMLETQELKEPHLTLTQRISRSSQTHELDDRRSPISREAVWAEATRSFVPTRMRHFAGRLRDDVSSTRSRGRIRIGDQGRQLRGELKGDRDCPRTSQVLTNLIGNALEHGSSGAHVTVDVHGDDKEVTIAIHNQGAAIPTDQLKGIFNPMKRTATTGNTGFDGSSGNLGLGLYIAERIVHAHNGRIEVESAEERGTTFTVHLPRRGKPDTAPDKPDTGS